MDEIKIVLQQGVINSNFEELKAAVLKKTKEYDGAIFTEDSIVFAKKVVADFRNDKKELNAKRIEKEKEYMKNFNENVTQKIEELFVLYDKGVDQITKQLDEYEKKRVSDKKAEIENWYKKIIGEISEYLPLSKIYNARWENVGFKIKDIILEMQQVIDSVNTSIETIKAMNADTEYTDIVLNEFKTDLSLVNAIAKINKQNQLKARIEQEMEAKIKAEQEAERNAEIERVKAEERKKVEAERIAEQKKQEEINMAKQQASFETEQRLLSVKTPHFVPPVDIPELDAAFEPDDIIKAIFTVYGSADEISQVEMYLNSIGLEHKKE